MASPSSDLLNPPTAILRAASSGSSDPACGLRTWRQRYWRLCARGRRGWRELAKIRRLRQLRDLALRAPGGQPGCLDLDGYRVWYDNPLALYMEYKHIFVWGIYDFRPAGPRPLVVDCGSHIGLSVLRFKRLAPDCRIIALEPDPRALELLRRNIEENRLTDVQVVPAALAGTRGSRPFVPDGADGGTLVDEGYAPGWADRVPTTVLSDYLTEPVELLKMNIEGAECEVLHEAVDRLHLVSQLAVEYHAFPERGQKLHEILELLDACGFRYLVHHFDYETNPHLRPPFRIAEGARFFQLVAARRLWERQAARSPGRSGAVSPVRFESAGGPPPSLEPLSRKFGADRGHSIDRYYIEDFLGWHSSDVRGRVLEVADPAYTRRFGGSRVTRSDVISLVATPTTTIVGDLTRGENLPDQTYDCVILTQTLPMIFDVRAALRTVHRILKPGGVLLLTVPGISQASRYDAQRWGDYWRFTPQSVRLLLAEVFDPASLSVRFYGNLRAAMALLEGRVVHELDPDQLNHLDEDYPVIIAARAVRRV